MQKKININNKWKVQTVCIVSIQLSNNSNIHVWKSEDSGRMNSSSDMSPVRIQVLSTSSITPILGTAGWMSGDVLYKGFLENDPERWAISST